MTDLTVKLTSPNGSWEDVKPLIKAIIPDAKSLGVEDIHIEVGDVWSSSKKNSAIQYNAENANNNVFFANQRGDELA